jgi:hypothetical protein
MVIEVPLAALAVAPTLQPEAEVTGTGCHYIERASKAMALGASAPGDTLAGNHWNPAHRLQRERAPSRSARRSKSNTCMHHRSWIRNPTKKKRPLGADPEYETVRTQDTAHTRTKQTQ